MSWVDHTYCLTLRRRADRWRRMRARLRRRGIAAERFFATDGDAIELDSVPATLIEPSYDSTRNARWDRHVTPGRRCHLTAGELGCALSHLAIWDDILRRRHRVSLVLEDDVDFAPDFVARVGALLDVLPRRWDVTYLGYVNTAGPISVTRPGLGQPRHLFGTFAYLVSRRGAERLLAQLPVVEPIDNFMASRFASLDVWCAVPALVRPQRFAARDSDVARSARAPAPAISDPVPRRA